MTAKTRISVYLQGTKYVCYTDYDVNQAAFILKNGSTTMNAFQNDGTTVIINPDQCPIIELQEVVQ